MKKPSLRWTFFDRLTQAAPGGTKWCRRGLFLCVFYVFTAAFVKAGA